ncbi:hypothetical protein Tco_0273917 [Tanacetum coccineum]
MPGATVRRDSKVPAQRKIYVPVEWNGDQGQGKESTEVTQTPVASECDSLKLKVTGLESAIVEKDHELSEIERPFFPFSLKSSEPNVLLNQLEMYEGLLKRLEEYQDNLMEPLRTRLAEIDADFTRCYFASIDDPLSAEALIEPPVEVPATNVLSTVVIVPHADPSVSVEDYDNPDSADVVPENAILGSESEGKIDASTGDGLTFSQLDDEARKPVYERIVFPPAFGI